MKRSFLATKKATAFMTKGFLAVVLAMSTMVFVSSCDDDETAAEPAEPAVASFTETVDVFTVTFISTSTGAETYAWDFGDGQTATTANAENVYTSPGDYEVTLTVVGADEESDAATKTISIVIPESAFINGDFDMFAADSEEYQANNDEWEPPTADEGWVGLEGFRACGMTTDGKKTDTDEKTNGIKVYQPVRGFYQVVDVVVGATYVVTFEAATEVQEDGTNLFTAYALSTDGITSEDQITADNTMASVDILATPTSEKGAFVTYSLEFTATTDKMLWFGFSNDPLCDSSREIWLDNFVIDFK